MSDKRTFFTGKRGSDDIAFAVALFLPILIVIADLALMKGASYATVLILVCVILFAVSFHLLFRRDSKFRKRLAERRMRKNSAVVEEEPSTKGAEMDSEEEIKP